MKLLQISEIISFLCNSGLVIKEIKQCSPAEDAAGAIMSIRGYFELNNRQFETIDRIGLSKPLCKYVLECSHPQNAQNKL